MCEHCGCRGVPLISELMDEHYALAEMVDQVRHGLSHRDRDGVLATLEKLGERLIRHVSREERGIFAALKEQGDFADEVAVLEAEHLAFDITLDELDPDSSTFAEEVGSMMDDLITHIEKENLGVFPVTVVTLGPRGWATIEAAHDEAVSFLVG